MYWYLERKTLVQGFSLAGRWGFEFFAIFRNRPPGENQAFLLKHTDDARVAQGLFETGHRFAVAIRDVGDLRPRDASETTLMPANLIRELMGIRPHAAQCAGVLHTECRGRRPRVVRHCSFNRPPGAASSIFIITISILIQTKICAQVDLLDGIIVRQIAWCAFSKHGAVVDDVGAVGDA